MNIELISGSIKGIEIWLTAKGYSDMQSVKWLRTPCRINGTWHAEVRHE